MVIIICGWYGARVATCLGWACLFLNLYISHWMQFTKPKMFLYTGQHIQGICQLSLPFNRTSKQLGFVP